MSDLDPMAAAVQTLQAQILDLQALGQQANPDGLALQGQFLATQQQFQAHLLPLGDRPSLAPVLTEMNRTLRLLAMDVAFLQAARQPMKVQQRQRQLLNKLQQLSQFCDALIPLINEPQP